MLHILFMILKIIGIVLAVAVGILLAAFVCVLFVPIRYHVLAEGKLGEEEPVHVGIKVTWLLHMVNAVFSYSKAARLRVRLFCFTLFDTSGKKDGKEKKGKRREAKKTEKGNPPIEGQEPEKDAGDFDAGIEDGKKIESCIEEPRPVEKEDVRAISVNQGNEEGILLEEEPQEEDGIEEKRGGIRAVFEAIRLFFKKLLGAVQNIEYTIRQICDKIKNVMENIRYYTNIMKGEAFQKVFKNAKKQLFWILRRIKPKKCQINLTAGTGDPASTGQIMAVYGMLYPFIGSHVLVQTDFENKVIEGDLYIRGKVVAIVFLIAGVRIVLDKNIWKLFKMLKKEDA